MTYGYNGSGQLTTLTRGAGTTDALTTTFGYSGTQLISVTTPYTQATRTWTLSFDDAGRLVSLASSVSGTLGQAGYTPAYTTLLSYTGGTTTPSRWMAAPGCTARAGCRQGVATG